MMHNDLHFQNYLVVFIDHLGQGERLRKITGIPTTDDEKQKFIENIKESFGRVKHIRNNFKIYFESARSHKPNANLVEPKLQDTFLATQKTTDVIYYGISDAMVIAVPLMSNGDSESCAAINGVREALMATCMVALLALSENIPLRAGLDVGIAAKIGDNEIYGPVLANTFYLESKNYDDPLIGLAAIRGAKVCKELIIQDTDGRYMLDFLGNTIKTIFGSIIDQKVIISAFEFVTSQYEKYQKENNEILASRYYRLWLYFNSRKSIWEKS